MISEGLTLDWGVGARGRGKEKEQRRVWFRIKTANVEAYWKQESTNFFFFD